jgi:hypothetical protein
MDFTALISAVKHGNVFFQQCDISSSCDWIIQRSSPNGDSHDFPTLTHPEVRDSVDVIARQYHPKSISDAIINLCGLNSIYDGCVYASWESVHILCIMADYLEPSAHEKMGSIFTPKAQSDPMNVLLAVLCNWSRVSNSCLRQSAIGFLKSIPYNYQSLNRPFIWQAVQAWADIDSDVRRLVLEQTSDVAKDESLIPKLNQYTTLTFIAAGLSNYNEIKESSREGFSLSEAFLSHVSILLAQIKNPKPTLYKSQRNDGVFPVPGEQHDAAAVLAALKRIADSSSSFNRSESIYGILAGET